MKIEYWSDYACPYCYIGVTNLKEALRSLDLDDAEITMKAFELDPYASKEYVGPTTDRFAAKYGLSMKDAAQRIETISQTGRSIGLDFEYAQTRYTNTADAHRITKLAAERLGNEVANELSSALYDAYFAKGAELSDKETLVNLAVGAGLEENEVRQLLSGEEYMSEVRKDEIDAADAGVHAVPYFVIDGKHAVPGALPANEFSKVLLRALAENDAAQLRGNACGPDGCAI